ncbi:MAG: prepilin-type N-terminal cleavage/methylation domain-containing protein [Methylophagaceae bacterium]
MRQIIIAKLNKGFTLIELVLAMLIIGILATIAYGSYRSIIEGMNTNQAIADIYEIELIIERNNTTNNSLPADMNELIALGAPSEDPWGQPYAYLPFTPTTPNGPKRKSHGTVPLNSDYDLYSKGPDGLSSTPLTAARSRDDIVRASNGGFVGLGADY